MGALILIFLILLFANSYRSAKRMIEKQPKKDYVVEEVAKFCPPHKWRYLEVKDQEGATIKWRLVCDICGPLKPITGPARLE